MTRDELTTAIRAAGLTVGTNISGVTLVGSPSTPGIAHITLEEMARLADTLVAAEREACAQVAEEESGRWAVPVTSADYREIWAECAAAIRARGAA